MIVKDNNFKKFIRPETLWKKHNNNAKFISTSYPGNNQIYNTKYIIAHNDIHQMTPHRCPRL